MGGECIKQDEHMKATCHAFSSDVFASVLSGDAQTCAHPRTVPTVPNKKPKGFSSTANYPVSFWELCVPVCVWDVYLSHCHSPHQYKNGNKKITLHTKLEHNILICIHIHDYECYSWIWGLDPFVGFDTVSWSSSGHFWLYTGWSSFHKRAAPFPTWLHFLSTWAHLAQALSSVVKAALTGPRECGCLHTSKCETCVMRVIRSLSFRQWGTWNSGLTDISITSIWIICIFKRESTSVVWLHDHVSGASLSLYALPWACVYVCSPPGLHKLVNKN